MKKLDNQISDILSGAANQISALLESYRTQMALLAKWGLGLSYAEYLQLSPNERKAIDNAVAYDRESAVHTSIPDKKWRWALISGKDMLNWGVDGRYFGEEELAEMRQRIPQGVIYVVYNSDNPPDPEAF